MEEWRWMTATALGGGIAAGQIDPVDLTETYLSAIASHEHRDRIYARVTADRARAEARAAQARARSGLRRGPLDGVPISWKDLFDTAGVATEAGTRLMEGRVPGQDAEVLQNATAAGLVCLGKTHLSEIAFSGLGLNPMTATSPNINDPEAVPGGSSSGAAASVAFGLAAAGIGSDTGGSVRIPAAWNDLVGLKTTHGRVSVKGAVPLCLTFDTVGPLCRSVEDAALLLAALEGQGGVDLTAAGLQGLRFGVLQTIVDADLQPDPRRAFEGACARLEAAGATLIPFVHPDLHDAYGLAGPLYTADSYGWWRGLVEAAPEKMYPQILERICAGKDVKAADFVAGWVTLNRLRESWADAVAGFDAVLMPTGASLPPKIARLEADTGYYVTQNLLALRNTRTANLMGLCAITLPTAVPSCGIMLNGAAGQEEHLLRVAAAVEGALR